jgi:hypothetical protein
VYPIVRFNTLLTPPAVMAPQIESKLAIDALLVAIMLVWAFTIIGTLIAMAPNFPMTVWAQEKVIAVTRPSVESEEIIKPSEITRRKCTA